MPSLWGSKQNADVDNDNDNENNNMTGRDSHDGGREPTERDRLLPGDSSSQRRRGQSNTAYLDPDDPAVSPYNLWTVRFLRYLTVLFFALAFLWWILLLVSIFVSPPGLHTRGSGYFDFAYTCLTLGLLFVQLVFFSAPSMAMRVTQAIVAVLLLVDLILIVTVRRLRQEEGPPGIASVTLATAVAVWCVMIDRIVAWGKREEEERLTGRAETRRTLRQWLAVLLATIILIVYIVITVFMTGNLILRARDAGLEFGGHRYYVDAHKYQVHLDCVGYHADNDTNPTILLEAAEDPAEASFQHWLYAAYHNGTINRYCYWDRPGYAFSDNAPSPHSAGMSADNLAEALAVKGELGPFVVVSAGYGSLVSRIFSARHFRQVIGIMLIDPLHEDLLPRIGDPSRGFMLWAWGIISPLGVERVFGTIFTSQTGRQRLYGRQSGTNGRLLKAKLQENLVATSLTRSEVSSARTIQAPETPLVVVSSGLHMRADDEWRRKQEESTKVTDRLLHWDVVPDAPHYVWMTQDGRRVLEKCLGQLVKAATRLQEERADSREE